MKAKHLLSILLLWGGIFSTQAATFKAISTGNWNDNIWDQPGYPGMADSVVIDGFIVIVPAGFIANAKSVTLVNSDELNQITKLGISSAQLIVQNQFNILSNQSIIPSLNYGINLSLYNSTIEIGGDFKVLKANGDTNLGVISIEASGTSTINTMKDMTVELNEAIQSNSITHKVSVSNLSNLLVQGDFRSEIYNDNMFNFVFSDFSTLMIEQNVILNSYNKSSNNYVHNSLGTSNISGNVQLNSTGSNGDNLPSEINLNAGTVNIEGKLDLTSDDPSQLVDLHLNGVGNTLSVDGGITIDARHQSTVSIVVDQASTLEVGNTIDKATDYGNLFMNPNSHLVYHIDNLTTLPVNNTTTFNTDQFNYSNVKIVNTSGSPLQLDGPMILDYSLEIGSGIIQTDSINLIILRENATITGGNEDAYIDGPIEKRGISSQTVILPLGNKGIYAPLEVNPVTDPNSIFRMQFFGDPPPIGSVPPDLDRINENQHWIIDRVAGSPVDVVMHWHDGVEAGMSDMDMNSITTVYFDSDSNEWTNAGRGTVTGGNTAGVTGSIGSDMLGDPPPIGAVAVTIGTVSTNSALPVELLKFKVEKEQDAILLTWVTTAEIDLSHFELERSLDGIEFTKIGSKNAVGGETKITDYSFKDKTPKLGTNYYRLRSVDLDGSEDFSRVVSITFQNVSTPVAVPNPVREQLLIMDLNPGISQATVEVFNSSGQVLFHQNMTVNNGKIELQMQAVNVTIEGTYYIRIIEDLRTHNITIFKK